MSATDPDCGVNAMVNYTLGDGFGKLQEFEVRSGTGEICITHALDYESRNVFEFPVIATDRGKKKSINKTYKTTRKQQTINTNINNKIIINK